MDGATASHNELANLPLSVMDCRCQFDTPAKRSAHFELRVCVCVCVCAGFFTPVLLLLMHESKRSPDPKVLTFRPPLTPHHVNTQRFTALRKKRELCGNTFLLSRYSGLIIDCR